MAASRPLPRKRFGPRRGRKATPSRFVSSNSSCPWVVRRTGISSKRSRETIVTSVAPPRSAARAESRASFAPRLGLGGERLERPQRPSPEPQRGARRVEGHEAAADDDHVAAQVHAVALVDVQQVVDGLDDPVELDAGHVELAALGDADREEDGLEALPPSARQDRRRPTSGVPSLRVTPSETILSISARIRVRGSRYSGMPKRIMPPGSAAASKTVTS